MSKIITPGYISLTHDSYTVVWGNKLFNLNDFTKTNKIETTSFCEQSHSNLMMESNPKTPPLCDAIFTSKKNSALVIKTADCVPVLVKHNEYIFALHAGWRGLSNNILLRLLEFKPDDRSTAYIGPHINSNSYEVGEEVLSQILTNNPKLKASQTFFAKPVKNKFLLNLKALTVIQLTEAGFNPKNIFSEDINTLTNLNWNSYRRDQKNAGRNLSLIVQH